MIKIENISYVVNQHVILKEVSLTLTEKRVAVIGANGSGKSTFLRLLNGLLMPTTGQILVDDLNTLTAGKKVRHKVGFVFQNPDNQIVFPIVKEDLAFGLQNKGYKKEHIEQKITETLTRYGLLHLIDKPTHQLSGGEKQLIAIAGVLVMEPQYIIMDEPTTLLDLRNKRKVNELISQLEQTIIMVSHDLELLQPFERVLVFHEGAIVKDSGPIEALNYYLSIMS